MHYTTGNSNLHKGKVMEDIVMSNKIKELDKKYNNHITFFKELRAWLNKNQGDITLRKDLKKRITNKFLKNYTKMKNTRSSLLKSFSHLQTQNIQDRKDRYLRNTYNITLKDYNELLWLQDKKCAICENTKNGNHKYFFVDHCHTTGKVRALLCHGCNAGLGLFKENIYSLEKAIKYLKHHNTKE